MRVGQPLGVMTVRSLAPDVLPGDRSQVPVGPPTEPPAAGQSSENAGPDTLAQILRSLQERS